MISAAIFILHAALALLLFLRGKRQSMSDAWLGVATVLMIFAVGWTLATFLTNLLWPERGIGLLIDDWGDSAFKQFLYREVNQNAGALVLLTIGEIPLYRKILQKDKVKGKEEALHEER